MGEQDDRRWREFLHDTTQRAPASPADAGAERVPCLTVLWHPDLRVVGGRAVLRGLASAGSEVALSRLEPDFLIGGDGPPRPLADPFLSRRPIRLRQGPAGEVHLSATGSSARLVVDGAPIDDELTLVAEQLARGVVLLLNERVALLLHSAEAMPAAAVPDFGLVGDSAAIVEVRRQIQQASGVAAPVLLRGETGTGKELVARAIHEAGPRRGGPYVAVNLAAIPPSLAAAELFGAARGAYTGAVQRQPGYFARADGGTLFLDEIGDVPLDVQSLLLRVLETREVQPVGGGLPQAVDVRVIVATDSDLEARIAAGEFRSPLLHRLGGCELMLPPLRRRREDVGRLLLHFLREELRAVGREELLAPRAPREPPWLEAPLVARLAACQWPGNVRQLRGVARQLVVAHHDRYQAGATPQIERLLGAVDAAPPTPVPVAPRPAPASRAYRKPSTVGEDELLAALEAHRFELKAAARALGISRPALYLLIDRCPRVRKAADLDRREVERALAGAAGDLDAAAHAVQVSREGLRQRLRALGLPSPATSRR
ncbi:MAG TPA: sigma 54-interacting transcriptional regulator [Thermoanaerobaculia bacterium]|nr:sigma 54-interacting transcriptional regulator [Thermoanaerobaculia bacterium]